MKCAICETEFVITKKDIKKELAYKIGDKITLTEKTKQNFDSPFFGRSTWTYRIDVYDLTCMRDLYHEYVICPVCDERHDLRYIFKPIYLYGLKYTDHWTVTTTSKEVVE